MITRRPTGQWSRGANGEAEDDPNDYSKDPVFMNNWTPNVAQPIQTLVQLKGREQAE